MLVTFCYILCFYSNTVPCNNGTNCTSSIEGETVPDTFKCTAYHNCTDNHWLYMNCPAGMYYSHKTGYCTENVGVCVDNVCIVNDIVTPEILIPTSAMAYTTVPIETISPELTSIQPDISTTQVVISTLSDEVSTETGVICQNSSCFNGR